MKILSDKEYAALVINLGSTIQYGQILLGGVCFDVIVKRGEEGTTSVSIVKNTLLEKQKYMDKLKLEERMREIFREERIKDTIELSEYIRKTKTNFFGF